MKNVKEILSVLLSALLLAVALPSAFAFGADIIASGNGGEGVTWQLDADGVLTVSGNGPIVDTVEVEYDEDGNISSTSMVDCIGWQINDAFYAQTEGMSDEEISRARYDFVKELVIEEGITEIPGSEFSEIYPRSIILPSTLTFIGGSAINASFADSITIGSSTLVVAGGVTIAVYRDGAEPYASKEAAINAIIENEAANSELSDKLNIVNALSNAYEILAGVADYMTAEEFLDDYNSFHETDFADLDAFIAYALEKANETLGTSYASADEVFSVMQSDGLTYIEKAPALEEMISAMYDAIDISDRISFEQLGTKNEAEDSAVVAYKWLTVNAPAGSEAERAAKVSGLIPDDGSDARQDASFRGKIRAFFAKIKAFFEKIGDFFKKLFIK